jgi:Fe-Mn family superoxide dismutase
MTHKLPDLPYDYSALEPHIDTRTKAVHHDKHHLA